MRKLASVRVIDAISAIPGADAIEVATIGGWDVVVKKGEYKPGDVAVYFEVDSWIPTTLAGFLTKPGQEPREYEGIKGERLKTVKLRGQLSQGLLLPLDVLPSIPDSTADWKDEDDVTELLGILKWEPPVSPQLAGLARGNFPGWLRKTDQERVQTCFKHVSLKFDEEWVIEEKLEGSSMTVGYNGGDIVVCSRNLSLKLDGNEGNSFIDTANKCGILDALKLYNKDLGISGELIGEGIQGNLYKLTGFEWRIFDILDVRTGKYVDYDTRLSIIKDLNQLGAKLLSSPLVARSKLTGKTNYELLSMADGKSALNDKQLREGLVFKNQQNPDLSFKAVSNTYLLKSKS